VGDVMKKLLGWIAVVVFAAGAAVAQPFLGVNLNATPDELDPRLMQQSGATWVRTMVDVVGAQNAVSDGKRASALNMTRWQTFIQMGQRGTAKTILSLKFDFRSAGQHPPKPGSTEEAALFAFMDHQILDILAPTTSIIVSGNEPFVNTMPQDERKKVGYGGVPVVLFYQRVTEHVQDYLVKNGLRSRNQLYFGAFTNLEKPDMQSDPAVQAMLAYAAGNKDVDGIDVHAHVASLDEISTIMNFVRGFTAKPLIVTEYTYVKAQRAGLTQGLPLGAGFAETYNLDPAMTELDFLRCAVFRRSAGNP